MGAWLVPGDALLAAGADAVADPAGLEARSAGDACGVEGSRSVDTTTGDAGGLLAWKLAGGALALAVAHHADAGLVAHSELAGRQGAGDVLGHELGSADSGDAHSALAGRLAGECCAPCIICASQSGTHPRVQVVGFCDRVGQNRETEGDDEGHCKAHNNRHCGG